MGSLPCFQVSAKTDFSLFPSFCLYLAALMQVTALLAPPQPPTWKQPQVIPSQGDLLGSFKP